jgi:hypothetical protein
LLCAPTGRAAKRMTQATGLEDDHPLSRFCRTSRTLPFLIGSNDRCLLTKEVACH